MICDRCNGDGAEICERHDEDMVWTHASPWDCIRSLRKQAHPEIGNDNVCPYCKSKNITVSPYESDTNMAWCIGSCDECKHEWRWFYKLSGLELLSEKVEDGS